MSPLTAVWQQFQDKVSPESFVNSMSRNPFTPNWTTLTINTQPSSESKSESEITFLIFKRHFLTFTSSAITFSSSANTKLTVETMWTWYPRGACMWNLST